MYFDIFSLDYYLNAKIQFCGFVVPFGGGALRVCGRFLGPNMSFSITIMGDSNASDAISATKMLRMKLPMKKWN